MSPSTVTARAERDASAMAMMHRQKIPIRNGTGSTVALERAMTIVRRHHSLEPIGNGAPANPLPAPPPVSDSRGYSVAGEAAAFTAAWLVTVRHPCGGSHWAWLHS